MSQDWLGEAKELREELLWARPDTRYEVIVSAGFQKIWYMAQGENEPYKTFKYKITYQDKSGHKAFFAVNKYDFKKIVNKIEEETKDNKGKVPETIIYRHVAWQG